MSSRALFWWSLPPVCLCFVAYYSGWLLITQLAEFSR